MMCDVGLLALARNKSITPEDFEKKLWLLSTGETRKGRRYFGTIDKPIRVFRSRVFSKAVLPTDVMEYSYPSPSKCAQGRANQQNAPIFYASAGGPTTFVESRSDIGDIVVVSEFRCHQEMVVQEIGFADIDENATEYEIIMHELFISPGNEFYEYSSRIASHLINGGGIHGITYPSLASNSSSQNLALKTSFVDTTLKIVNMTAYKIKSLTDPFKYEVDEIDFGIVEDGKVSWKGRKKKWTLTRKGQQLQMISNGWSWEAHDEKGNLVDPE